MHWASARRWFVSFRHVGLPRADVCTAVWIGGEALMIRSNAFVFAAVALGVRNRCRLGRVLAGEALHQGSSASTRAGDLERMLSWRKYWRRLGSLQRWRGGLCRGADPLRRLGSNTGSSFIGGGQIGCDYQFASNWVIGMQGLIDAADITRARQSVLFPGEEFHYKTQWFATITGRIGFLVTPTFLIYGRGGWGFVDQRLTATGGLSDSSTRSFSGPDAGAGFEWMFARNWTLWAEWDHIFGSDKTLVFTPTSTITASDRVRREFDKALVGLNWRFGGYSPVSAAY
jgi:outer membrane immunogenic protein